MTSPTQDQITTLATYTACDISDALLKLKVPNAGFLCDFKLQVPPETRDVVTVAPASTVTFVDKGTLEPSNTSGPSNIPKGKHWVDLCEKGTIVVISQPRGQKCAVLGGIMGLRMKVLGVRGVVVEGRVRDLGELRGLGGPIWSKGTSTVGAGAEAKPHLLQTPLNIEGTKVSPGDLVFSDPRNGVVVIPQELVEDVLGLLPGLGEADGLVMEGVRGGMSVGEAFEMFR